MSAFKLTNEVAKLVVRECTWQSVWPEGASLFAAHEKEIGLQDASTPLDINVELCEQLERMGCLRIVGAFDGRGLPLDCRPRLVGYVFWYVSPNLLSRHNIVADQGPWYVVPELRRTPLGYRLMQTSIEMLHKDGVHQMMVHRAEGSPKGIEKMFAKFGGTRREEVWEIKL